MSLFIFQNFRICLKVSLLPRPPLFDERHRFVTIVVLSKVLILFCPHSFHNVSFHYEEVILAVYIQVQRSNSFAWRSLYIYYLP